MDSELEAAFLEWKLEEQNNIRFKQLEIERIRRENIKKQQYKSDMAMLLCFLMALVFCNHAYDIKKMTNEDYYVRVIITFLQLIYLIHILQSYNNK